MTDWDRYLSAFHAERAGITEAVLCRARDADGKDPYAWLAEAIGQGAAVIDLACGSAPV